MFRIRQVLLAFPLVFLIHDIEEVLTAERFWRENRASFRLPRALALRTNQLEITTGNFAVAVAYLFTLVFSVSWLAARSLKPGRWMDAFASGVSVLLLNVFTQVGQTIALRRYTPGVFTAVLVALPYSLYALRRLRAEQLLDKQRVRQCLLAGAFVGVPLALSAHVVAGWLTHFVRLVKQ